MTDFDKTVQENLVKEYATNSKKFYSHIETCDECRSKLTEIWQHSTSQ